MMKFDPYLNVDPGTMNPFQHGEVFVTDNGGETDLDLGHYERFIDSSLSKRSSITSGKLYSSLIERERRGDFNGGTVQVVPHLTNAIKQAIKDVATKDNACLLYTSRLSSRHCAGMMILAKPTPCAIKRTARIIVTSLSRICLLLSLSLIHI